ncbi:hypothetical protein GCHA_3229 [Paraglaciecola chathamensis S18K6]|uniref:Transposase n=1 Tax=Paraglaciecola chathamensis S18K6 TaxID=1127672 RepID=A0AAV3V2D6_9ALTE|nr:hypothetical protein GCHA_3229 [Paraglaciecola chathamensis S18K6]
MAHGHSFSKLRVPQLTQSVYEFLFCAFSKLRVPQLTL